MNFYEKLCVPVVTWNKKHLSKQAVPITYALGRRFLQLLLLKACGSFLFRQSKNIPSWYLLAQSQQWKYQNNVWNLFKVNNKDTRTEDQPNVKLELLLSKMRVVLNGFIWYTFNREQAILNPHSHNTLFWLSFSAKKEPIAILLTLIS